jgi:hypothetical protein
MLREVESEDVQIDLRRRITLDRRSAVSVLTALRRLYFITRGCSARRDLKREGLEPAVCCLL